MRETLIVLAGMSVAFCAGFWVREVGYGAWVLAMFYINVTSGIVYLLIRRTIVKIFLIGFVLILSQVVAMTIDYFNTWSSSSKSMLDILIIFGVFIVYLWLPSAICFSLLCLIVKYRDKQSKRSSSTGSE